MNKIEVISKENVVSNIDGLLVKVDNDTLIININSEIKETIVLINSICKNVSIIAGDSARATITEIKDAKTEGDFRYEYVLGNYASVNINKFYYMGKYNEDIKIDLDGYESNILFNLSSMSFGYQRYTIDINHNNKKTVSNIFNHGVTFNDGTLDLIVNGRVKKGMTDSILNQDNKIMTMGNGKSMIRPNLFIDENMVEARHGASIGRFNEEELFYLKTRGISEEEGYHLLLIGFLLGNLQLEGDMKKELGNIIEKFGR